MEYPSVEHAYQATKTFDIRLRRRIQEVKSAAEARILGEQIERFLPREDGFAIREISC